MITVIVTINWMCHIPSVALEILWKFLTNAFTSFFVDEPKLSQKIISCAYKN